MKCNYFRVSSISNRYTPHVWQIEYNINWRYSAFDIPDGVAIIGIKSGICVYLRHENEHPFTQNNNKLNHDREIDLPELIDIIRVY